MAAVNIKAFRGAVPRIGSRLLQPNQAEIADNCKLTSGNLEPIKGPQLVHTSQPPDLAPIDAVFLEILKAIAFMGVGTLGGIAGRKVITTAAQKAAEPEPTERPRI